MTQVNLSLKDIYAKLCPECQEKLRDMVKSQLTDQAVKDALEGKVKDDDDV